MKPLVRQTPGTALRVRTDDDVLLDGFLRQPDAHTASSAHPAGDAVDLCLLVHGTTANFYAGGVLERFSETAFQHGVATLRINTRGHDVVTVSRGGGQRGFAGAAFECVAEGSLDLDAWLAAGAQLGFRRIVLVGHSMGAVKSLLYGCRATVPTELVGVLAVSPPRFCHAHWQSHPRAEAFRSDYVRASQCVAEGQYEQLLRVSQPLPLLITAAGFLEKYGPEDRYDYVPHLAAVQRPTHILVGAESVAGSPAFAGLPEQLAQATREPPLAPLHQATPSPTPRLTFEIVPDADINYTRAPEAPFHAFWRRFVTRS